MNDIKLNSISFQAQVTQQEAAEQVKKIQKALDEMKQAEGWEEYMEMSDIAELNILKAKLEGALPYLEHIAATGEIPAMPDGDGSVGGASNPDPWIERIRTLTPGWNGDATLSTQPIEGYENVSEFVGGAEFAGYVYIDDDGDPSTPLQLVLQASATTQKIEAFNRGSDIVYVETFLDGEGREQKRFFVGIDHATNVRADIAIDTHNLDHAVTIDLSRVLRMGDGKNGIPAGEKNGFVIHGSDFDDTILGSQAGDTIEGHKGDDTIRAFGGDDTVYGDDSRDFAASRGALGLDTELADGSDTIDGGVGADALEGGGGINYGFETDVAHKSRIHHDLKSNTVSWNNDEATEKLLGGANNGWAVQQSEPGKVVLTETGPGNGSSILDLKMPEGFDMVSGEAQADQSLKLTFVGTDSNGKPQTLTVIVKGALRNRELRLDSPLTLSVTGNNNANIIDFSSVHFGNNIFRVDARGGDDMVLAPQTVLTAEGLSFQELIGPNVRVSDVETGQLASAIVSQENVNVSASDNRILVERTGPMGLLSGKHLHIDPQDFDKAYVTVNPDNENNLYVILVREGGEGLPPQTLLVEIEHYKAYSDDPANLGSWLSIGANATLGDSGGNRFEGDRPRGGFDIPVITLTHFGKATGSIIDAGRGDDFVYHGGEGSVRGAESETIGNYQSATGSTLEREAGLPEEGAPEGEGEAEVDDEENPEV